MLIFFFLTIWTIYHVQPVSFNRTMDMGGGRILNKIGSHETDESDEMINHTTDLQTHFGFLIEPIENACKAYMDEFGNASSNFVECSIDYARPFRFCENCVVSYKRSMAIYDEIQKNDDHLSGCRDKLLKADRIQVLKQVYKNIDDVWTDAKCSMCFDFISYDNGIVTYEIDNTTAEFVQQFAEMNGCILNNTSNNDGSRNSKTCERCKEKYKRLNKLYGDLSKNSQSGICMDIVDMMNYTKQKWGSDLHCSDRTVDVAPIIVIAVIVFLMPVIFYISNRIYGQKQYRKLMTQKRMTRQAVNSLYSAHKSAREGLLPQNSASSSRTDV